MFLPFPGDDELSPESAAALAAFRAEHPGPISNLDRTLLGSAAVFEAYLGWFRVRDEVVPFIGERAVDLFSLAVCRSFGAAYPSRYFEGVLRAAGDDPDAPAVTEAEALLIEWGAAIGGGATAIPADLTGRVTETFQPRLRLALTAYAGLMIAVCVFTAVGEVPEEE